MVLLVLTDTREPSLNTYKTNIKAIARFVPETILSLWFTNNGLLLSQNKRVKFKMAFLRRNPVRYQLGTIKLSQKQIEAITTADADMVGVELPTYSQLMKTLERTKQYLDNKQDIESIKLKQTITGLLFK
jgi:hypothetical protein